MQKKIILSLLAMVLFTSVAVIPSNAKEGDANNGVVPKGPKDGEKSNVPKGPKDNKEGKQNKEGKKSTIVGEISKIDGQSITITSRGDNTVRDTIVVIGAQTKILLETGEKVAREGKEGGFQPKMSDGTTADLKIGQRATVLLQNGMTVSVTIKFKPPQKEGDGKPKEKK